MICLSLKIIRIGNYDINAERKKRGMIYIIIIIYFNNALSYYMVKQHVLDLERKREEQENDQILHTICFILFIWYL